MRPFGKLYVFEGPDGVGKSALSRRFAQQLVALGTDCEYLAFPGNDEGTLGKHIYDLHHDAQRYGIRALRPASLQVLHVAAHWIASGGPPRYTGFLRV